MTFTEQQVLGLASFNKTIRNMVMQVYEKRIEEEKNRIYEEEIKVQLHAPTEEELRKAFSERSLLFNRQDTKKHHREYIPLDQQLFYIKFLNKRNKQYKRK